MSVSSTNFSSNQWCMTSPITSARVSPEQQQSFPQEQQQLEIMPDPVAPRTPPASPEQQLELENQKSLSRDIFIKIKPENRSELSVSPKEIQKKLNSVLGRDFVAHIKSAERGRKCVSIKDALQINTISGKTIFDLKKVTEDDVLKISFHSYQIDQFEKLMEDKKQKKEKIDSGIFNAIRNTRKKKKTNEGKNINYSTAKALDSFFGTKIFDFKSTLPYAIKIAKDKIKKELPDLSFPSEIPKNAQNKRKRSDMSTEGLVVPLLKKQRAQEKNLTPLHDTDESMLQPSSSIEYSAVDASNFVQDAEAPLNVFHVQAQGPTLEEFVNSSEFAPTFQESSSLTENIMVDLEPNVDEMIQPENIFTTLFPLPATPSQQNDDDSANINPEIVSDAFYYSSKYEGWDEVM